MIRNLLASAVLLAIVCPAMAHFVYLVPDAGSAAVYAVFSDSLKPDEKVNIEKIENTKLFVIDASGKESAVKWTLDKPGSFFKIEVPGSGSRIVAGITDYGVLQRGESKPFLLKYYSKTIVGDIPSAEKAKIGERVPLEIVPIIAGDKIRFQVLAGGKPYAKAEISVMVPSEDKTRSEVSDEKGFTPEFDKAGQYGVNVCHVEAKGGEDKGKKYEESRSYATLVVNFAPAK